MPVNIPRDMLIKGAKIYKKRLARKLVDACDVHQYTVTTNRKYLITFRLSCENKVISANCSCHHGQDNVYCEHIAAALLQLNEDLDLGQAIKPIHFKRHYNRKTDRSVLYSYLKKRFDFYVENCNPQNNKAIMIEMETFLHEYDALYTDNECFKRIDKMIVDFFIRIFNLTPLYYEAYLKIMSKAYISRQLFNLDHLFYEINTHISQYPMERASINTIKKMKQSYRKDYLYDILCHDKLFYKCDRHHILLKHAEPDSIYAHFIQTYLLLNEDVDKAYEHYCKYKNEFKGFEVGHLERVFKNK